MHDHAATRLFVFPVAGLRRWAYVAKPPSLLHPIGATEAGKAATPDRPSGAVAALVHMGREVWGKAQGAGNQAERVEIVVDYMADAMHEQWVKLEQAPERSWKRRIHNWGTALLSRLRPSETLLKTMPKKAPGLEIVYPLGLNPELVRRRVRLLAKSGESRHRCLLYGATSILPFTMVLGVLPVPNLPFFWNLFRVHAHWSALRGSQRLLALTTVPAPEPGTESEKRGGGDGQAAPHKAIPRLRLVESEQLAQLSQPGQNTTAPAAPASAGGAVSPGMAEEAHLTDAQIRRICQELDLDPQLVIKWRSQT